MKGINLIIAILLTIGLSLETSTAIAENRIKIFDKWTIMFAAELYIMNLIIFQETDI